MAITNPQVQGTERIQMASGAHLDDATTPAAISLSLGFTPRYVKMINVTTIVEMEWFTGMGAADAFNNANHATVQRSLITSGGITVSGGTVTLPAPAQNDQVYWVAYS